MILPSFLTSFQQLVSTFCVSLATPRVCADSALVLFELLLEINWFVLRDLWDRSTDCAIVEATVLHCIRRSQAQ